MENPAEDDLDQTPKSNDTENVPEEPEQATKENDDMD